MSLRDFVNIRLDFLLSQSLSLEGEGLAKEGVDKPNIYAKLAQFSEFPFLGF